MELKIAELFPPRAGRRGASQPPGPSSAMGGFDFLHGRWRVTHPKLKERLAGRAGGYEFPASLETGISILGSYDSETSENTFPRVPVRKGEKIFVRFTRAPSDVVYQHRFRRLEMLAGWRKGLSAQLKNYEERPFAGPHLTPTARALLKWSPRQTRTDELPRQACE